MTMMQDLRTWGIENDVTFPPATPRESRADSVCTPRARDKTKKGRALALRRYRVTWERYCLVSVSIGALITHAAALFPVAERQVAFPQKHLS